METGLNLNTLTVDPKTGRVSFSGLGTGIDFQAAVNTIIQAKRIPAVTLENRITANTDKITALKDLRASLAALKTSIDKLRGAISVGNTSNIFAAKSVFASTTRTDGQAPSAAGNLVGVTVSNAAVKGVHELEVRRVATAHKISGKTFASQTTALSLSGSFTISNGTSGATITVSATDTLQDIRDRINNANTGTNATKVTASIVSISSIENVLVLTNDTTGTNLEITDTGTLLSDLGLSTTHGTGGFRNGLGASSKIGTASGFQNIFFDGTQDEASFLVSFDSATRVMTLTRGDGTTDTATVSATAIAAGSTERLTFSAFGAEIVLDSNFDKGTDITVAADATSITGGTGAIDAATVTITDSVGDISGITSSTLTLGSLATPAAITVSVGAFSGTFDGTATGTKTVTLSDGGGNSLTISFDVTATFDGTESAGSITLNELQNLVVSSGTPFSTVLQKAQTARLTADGLTNPKHQESAIFASKTAQLSTFLTAATFPGSFTINGTGSTAINYTSTDTLETLKDKINLETAATGVTATVVADGAGFRLDLDSASNFTLTDTNALLADLGVNDKLIIERTGNTITDLFAGTTLSLFAAERGTTIKIEVEQDLTAAKTEVIGFVNAYNTVRQLINSHQLTDPETGLKSSDAGVLFGDAAVRDAQLRLANLLGKGVSGVSADFSVLRQIGITLINNSTVSDPLLKNTLEVDESKLDQILLSNAADVRRLFAFDFTSSDPRVVLTGFSAKTQFSASGYTLNIGTFGQRNNDSAAVTSATDTLDQATSFGATTSGSFTVNGATVIYDVTTDTLDSLITAINTANAAANNQVTATKKTDADGKFYIDLQSGTQTPISVGGDTGDLVALLNFQPDLDTIDSANIGGLADGSDDGTVTTSGRTLTVTSQSTAEGLTLLYTGSSSVSGVQLDFTVGLAAEMSFTLDTFIDSTSGSIEAEIDSLDGQNDQSQDRIDLIDFRLELLRQSLLNRFIAMEAAVTSMNQILDGLKLQFEALTNANN